MYEIESSLANYIQIHSVLQQQNLEYPLRRITQEDNDIKTSKVAPSKDDHGRMAKKARNA